MKGDPARMASTATAGREREDLGRGDLGHGDLGRGDLQRCHLPRGDSKNSDFESSDFESSDFESSDFESSGLESSGLESSDLESSDLGSCDLETGDLENGDPGSGGVRRVGPVGAARALLGEASWLIVPGLLSTVYLRTSAARLGATFDEPLYVRAGLEGWRNASHGALLNEGVMPLPPDVQTLVPRLVELTRGRRFDLDAELEAVLSLARLGNLVFWWLLLAGGLLLGRRLAGPWGGRLAVLWLAFEPNLLAHAALATPDLALAALLVVLCWGAELSSAWSPRRRILLLTALFGLALAAKASALLFGPVLLVALQLARSCRFAPVGAGGATLRGLTERGWRALGPLPRELPWVMAGGVLIATVLSGSDWQTEASFVEWARSLPPSFGRDLLVSLAEGLRLFPNAGEAIVKKIAHNVRGHSGAYLLEHTWPRAFPGYFPLALSIKLALPALIAVAVMIAVRLRWAASGRQRSARAASLERNPALWATAALLLTSLTARVQIGVRLVLPLIALLAVAVAVDGARLAALDGAAGRRWRAVVTAATAWLALVALAVWPHALLTTNALWGGVEHGYRRLSDSNYDWGQGLPELRRWSAGAGLDEVWVAYFGTDPTLREPAGRPRLRWWPGGFPDDPAVAFEGRLVAVSTTLLYGAYTVGHPAVELLRAREPVERVATFLIFDFRRSPISSDDGGERGGGQ